MVRFGVVQGQSSETKLKQSLRECTRILQQKDQVLEHSLIWSVCKLYKDFWMGSDRITCEHYLRKDIFDFHSVAF